MKPAILACILALWALSPAPAAARDRDRLADRGGAGQVSSDARAERRERREERREETRERRRDNDVQDTRRDRDSRATRVERRMDAKEAARAAQRLNGGGRVLSVNPEGNAYAVRLLKDGEVRSYLIPAD